MLFDLEQQQQRSKKHVSKSIIHIEKEKYTDVGHYICNNRSFAI